MHCCMCERAAHWLRHERRVRPTGRRVSREALAAGEPARSNATRVVPESEQATGVQKPRDRQRQVSRASSVAADRSLASRTRRLLSLSQPSGSRARATQKRRVSRETRRSIGQVCHRLKPAVPPTLAIAAKQKTAVGDLFPVKRGTTVTHSAAVTRAKRTEPLRVARPSRSRICDA